MTDFESAVIEVPNKYCIIGAGSSGLVAAKNLKQHGIQVDVFEKEADLGGLWNYANPENSVYRSTHLISSKPLTEFTDFPLPEHFPDYPRHDQVMQYFRAYAGHFDLYEDIRFETAVRELKPVNGGWQVSLDDGENRLYTGVIVANGHLWDPRLPDYPGSFDGLSLHSKNYKTPDILVGKRVLIIGAGNSGCDIAVESAPNADRTFHSVRRGYHYVPKYLFGKPADQIGEMSLRMRVPLPLRRWINNLLVHLLQGRPEDFGLPRPDHKLFETHPIVNSQIFYYLGHGDIIPKPDVRELQGDRVLFCDGSTEDIDVIVYATGYQLSFPFLDRKHLNWINGAPAFFLHVFHPEYDNLFIAGMIQPDSGQWGLVDYQTKLIAKYIRAQHEAPRAAAAFKKLKAGRRPNLSGGIRYLDSRRHDIEIEHFSYRKRLQKLIEQLD